ncbi:hypothetical protein RRG08_012575 [Elysia crispata]|uniref:WD repeat-containing protein 93 n=1 Tax=Elysia crispata TaxID=231223 RepID=A0AAE1APA4_9GAST|nr:hypothetical protein RRG08_012575 [Elysia crispata]
MPVYIRKNVSFTPPSIYNMQLEDDSDYLLDPDQLRDILPQPYRMIDKILTQLLDSVWEIVETKDNALLAEARKIRPPLFDEAQRLDKFENASSMAASTDGKYIFFGLLNGLAAMDALSQAHLHSWHEENVQVTSIQTHAIGLEGHLLITLDDMGVARLFLWAYNNILFIKALNENAPESTSKILCQKCEASKKGDLFAAVFENTSTKEIWMEVHKSPIESWLSELENLGTALNKQKEEPRENKDHEAKDLSTAGQESDSLQESQNVTHNDSTSLEKLGIKLSLPVQVLKIKPPPEQPLPGNLSSSIASALTKVDTGDVLGTGLNHIVSSAHLESRDQIFNHKHEQYLKYLPLEKEEHDVQATFHFLCASNMINLGLDQSPANDHPVSLAVWWAGAAHLCQYSLSKSGGKDLEFKPDIVWPFTSTITCSATSGCTTYLSVGLENGNVILWNRQIGLCKAVLSASSKSAVKSICFLDPCLFPLDTPHYPPYPTSAATFLLAECADGSQALFDTCDGSQQIPRCVAEKPENDENKQNLLQIISALPELMLYTQKDGNMYIKDIGTGAALCQIGLPATHTVQNPWDPIFAIGGGGQILYLKGEGTEINEEGETNDISCVFMYHLRSYPLLDQYWNRGYTERQLTVYTTAPQRIATLMQERVQQQALRKPRLQHRWSQLRTELDLIHTARQAPLNSMRITTPSSITSVLSEVRFRKSRASVI